MFSLAAILLRTTNRKPLSPFTYWYSYGLALLAVGLFGTLFPSSFSSVLFWTARSTQWLGGVYMLIAAIASVREARGWSISLEAALHESEERFRSMYEHAAVGIEQVGVDGRLLMVNEALCRMLGYSENELLSKTCEEITHLEDRDRETPLLEAMLRGERDFYEIEMRYLHRDGSPIWVNLTSSPVKGPQGKLLYRTSIVQDITDRKRADQRIAHLSNFPELNPYPLFETDMEGKITYANPAALRLFPQLTETAPDRTVLEQWESVLAGFRVGGAESVVREVKVEDSVFIQAIHYAPQLGVVRSYFADITERKRAEEERETTIEFLRLVNRSLGTRDLIQRATTFFQQRSACEAVGIRLQEGGDYPYFEYRGFSKEFVLAENLLCKPDENGCVPLDSTGNPAVDCMCGNVIRGRFDPSKPFFTANGSFWANDTTRLLATTTDADRQARTRNRCNGEGYESVALIAIGSREQRLGLLQLNDRQKGRFSLETILLWERLAGYLAAALSKFRAEEALRESERRFRALVTASSGVVYRMSPDWSEMRQLHGRGFIADTEAPSRTWLQDYIHPDDQSRVLAVINEAIRTKSIFELEHRVLRVDGSVGWTFSRAIPLQDANGEIMEWFGAASDVTARKRAEEALLRSEKLASVGRMAATIAHEINNPLEAVTNLLFIAKAAKDPESARQYLDMADAELQRTAHITRQSLGFYRESNAPALTSVNALLESAVDLLKSKIKAKQAVIEKQWDGNVEVTAVAGELRQVFSNLLANSLDAIEANGTIKLRVSTGAAFKNGDRRVRVTIADNGEGISASARQRIFEPFFTTKGTVGTGLGLWVSKQIVDKHGGTIRMRSRNNGIPSGTVFSVVLPLESAPAARRQSAAV
jgi:PAS domain S-box-containing protein